MVAERTQATGQEPTLRIYLAVKEPNSIMFGFSFYLEQEQSALARYCCPACVRCEIITADRAAGWSRPHGYPTLYLIPDLTGSSRTPRRPAGRAVAGESCHRPAPRFASPCYDASRGRSNYKSGVRRQHGGFDTCPLVRFRCGEVIFVHRVLPPTVVAVGTVFRCPFALRAGINGA